MEKRSLIIIPMVAVIYLFMPQQGNASKKADLELLQKNTQACLFKTETIYEECKKKVASSNPQDKVAYEKELVGCKDTYLKSWDNCQDKLPKELRADPKL